MAEFKTAEQYVVAELESTKQELEKLKIEHRMSMEKLQSEYDAAQDELEAVHNTLSGLRDIITVRKDNYFGHILGFSSLYEREYPIEVQRLMSYFDLSVEVDEDE